MSNEYLTIIEIDLKWGSKMEIAIIFRVKKFGREQKIWIFLMQKGLKFHGNFIKMFN